MKRKYYLIYKTTNLINGKIYIGCHKTDDLQDSYLGSGKILNYAIKKYGKENFSREIIEIFDNPDDMFSLESTLVNQTFVLNDKNYNIMKGGHGGWEFVNKTKNFHKHNKTISILGGKAFAKKLNNCEKTKEAFKNNFIETGKLASKLKYPNGLFYGRNHSDETKALMSEKAKLRKGNKNSQYGTRWIHNLDLKKSKKIKKEDQVPEGWLLGRKLKF